MWAGEADWKPWKKTIWKLLWVLNAQLVNNWETPETGQKKEQPATQKKQDVAQKKTEAQTWKVEKLNWKTEIIREGNISYYVVQPGDTTRIIRNRLAQTQEFSYLQQKQYAPGAWGRSYLWFNIRDKNLKPGNKVPIPIETEKRQISDKEFYNKSKSAIDRVLSGKNPDYAEKVRKKIN